MALPVTLGAQRSCIVSWRTSGYLHDADKDAIAQAEAGDNGALKMQLKRLSSFYVATTVQHPDRKPGLDARKSALTSAFIATFGIKRVRVAPRETFCEAQLGVSANASGKQRRTAVRREQSNALIHLDFSGLEVRSRSRVVAAVQVDGCFQIRAVPVTLIAASSAARSNATPRLVHDKVAASCMCCCAWDAPWHDCVCARQTTRRG